MTRKDKGYEEFRKYESGRIKELRDKNPGMSYSDAKTQLEIQQDLANLELHNEGA